MLINKMKNAAVTNFQINWLIEVAGEAIHFFHLKRKPTEYCQPRSNNFIDETAIELQEMFTTVSDARCVGVSYKKSSSKITM